MNTTVKSFLAGLFLLATLGFTACGGDDNSEEPSADQAAASQEVVALGEALKKAYDNKDAATACSLLDPRDLKSEFGSRKICIKQVNAAISQSKGRPEIDFDEVTIDGDTASAVARGKEGGETSYDFVRIDGKWYIDVKKQEDPAGS